jgi:LacI family transcriptional regulator
MVTQQDIARHLGISQTTVSFALRGHPAVGAATVRQVREAARKLGYRPDPLISALMAQRRSRNEVPLRAKIAFLTPFPTRGECPSNYAAG